MSIRDHLTPGQSPEALQRELPDEIKKRVDRGRSRASVFAPARNEAWEFWANNPFAYLDAKKMLRWLEAGPAGIKKAGKDPWTSRLGRNIFRDLIEMEVSLATQRTPTYQVIPSTADPQKRSAAKLSQKVAYYGYDKWDLVRVRQDVVRHAVVADEGFAWPYWDSNVGPFVEDGEGGHVGVGELGVRVFGANQVGWEEGVAFEDSPWHYVEYACPPEEVTSRPDYIPSGKRGKELSPDADTEDLTKLRDGASKAQLVRVVEYIERPSIKHPKGRWLMIANGRIVAGKTIGEDGLSYRPYPCAEQGYTGIALHYLPYFRHSNSDRAQGPGRDLVDPMRTYLDCLNRLIEWKNLALNPQSVGPMNLKGVRPTNEPGKHYQVPGDPSRHWQWRQVPPIPRELFELMDRADADMRRIIAQTDVGSEADSATQAQILTGRDITRRDSFYKSLARFDSGFMRHCLTLVQANYDEERVLQIRGVAGWEPIEDFRGANLQDETDVRVAPDSVVPTTRQQVQDKIFNYASRGWITPERAMQALEENTADGLIADLENDAGRVNRIILAIQKGPEVLFGMPEMIGPDLEPAIKETGEPELLPDGTPKMRPRRRPGWMPRPFDNTVVHRYYIETFLKSEAFEHLEPGMQAATFDYYNALLDLEAEHAARARAQQDAVAEAQGRANAARDPGAKPLPDMPSPGGPGEIPTMNQPADQRGTASVPAA